MNRLEAKANGTCPEPSRFHKRMDWWEIEMVLERGFEPPRGCPHTVLSRARLPVPPLERLTHAPRRNPAPAVLSEAPNPRLFVAHPATCRKATGEIKPFSRDCGNKPRGNLQGVFFPPLALVLPCARQGSGIRKSNDAILFLLAP